MVHGQHDHQKYQPCSDNEIDDVVQVRFAVYRRVGTHIDVGKIEEGQQGTDHVAHCTIERQFETHEGSPFKNKHCVLSKL